MKPGSPIWCGGAEGSAAPADSAAPTASPPIFAALSVVRAAVFFALVSLAVSAPVAGQAGQEGQEGQAGQEAQRGLASVDALAAAGRAEEARAALETWWDSERTQSSRRDRQRGLWLRAVLTVDPGMASLDYQRLVVRYPGGPYSDEALVRLAMIAGSDGDLLRAAGYYRILLQDYPRSPDRVTARQWLSDHSEEIEAAEAAAAVEAEAAVEAQAVAEAQAIAEAQAAADSTEAVVEEAPPGAAAAAGEPEVAVAVEPEVADTVPGVEEPAEQATPEQEAPEQEVPEQEVPEQDVPEQDDAPAEEVGRYAVQLGAFSTQERADRLAKTLARAGIETRVVRVAGSSLVRVRVGRFTERSAASERMAEIKRLGYDVAVVSDAMEEEPMR